MSDTPDSGELPTVSGPDGNRTEPKDRASTRAGAQSFPGLEVLEEIAPGTGGMGRVYKARDISLDRIVAVKTMRQHMLTPEGLSFFEREARAAARLDDPNIVKIYRFEPDHAPPYYVMQFVEGKPLEMACRGRSPAFVAQVMEKAARALAYAHGKGIIHRDIKPSNILVDYQNEPHLADFGLAQNWRPAGGAGGDQEASGSPAMGTPFFLAPELHLGDGPATPAVDVYAFGVTLYRLLTERYPFMANSREELKQAILTRDPPLPQEFNPAIPEPLQRICLKAIERNPDARYQSAQALADDLRRFCEGREVFVRPTRYETELRGKLQNHATTIRLWREHHLIDVPEMDGLLRPYQKLMQAESPWHDLARRFPWETAALRVGGWLVLVGSILWFYYWPRLHSHDRILAIGIPTLVLSGVGWFFHRRKSRSTAFAFLSVGALLLPLFLGVLLTEYHLLRNPQSDTLELLGRDAAISDEALAEAVRHGPAPDFAPTNTQLTIMAGAFVAYLLLLLAATRSRVFVLWTGLGVWALFSTVLLQLGLMEWLSENHVAKVCLYYIGLALAFLLISLVLEWSGRNEWAAASYIFFPVPFVILMTELARVGAVEWFHVSADWSEETLGLWLMANGLVYLLVAFLSARATAAYIRHWGNLLIMLVPASLLIPPDVLRDKGFALTVIGGADFTSYELLSLLLSMGLAALGTRMRRLTLAFSGLAGLAAFVCIATVRHFQDDLSWPLALAASGGVAMAVAVALIVVRSRKRHQVLT